MINSDQRAEAVKTYAPVIIFISATFLLKLYEVADETNLIISVFLSMISFMVKSAMLKEKYGEYEDRKKIAYQSGLLTIIFFLIFLNGFLHWYKILHINLRTTIYFILLLLYFIILFRAVHLLKDIKIKLESGDKKRKK